MNRDTPLKRLAVINVGLEDFARSLEAQEIPAEHVEWQPPATIDSELEELLARLI